MFDNLLYRYAWYRKWRGLPDPPSPETIRVLKEIYELAARDPILYLTKTSRPFPEPVGGTIKIRMPNTYTKVRKEE